MNKFFKFSAALLCGAVCLGFASCSDDDEPNSGSVSTEDVFPEGLPAEIDGAKITTNAAGQVVKIEDGSSVATFEYGSFSRANTYQARLIMTDTDYPDERTEFYMQINEKGFISHALEIYIYEDGQDEDTWDFGYNADGQLNYMKRSEGDNEVTTITYTDGNITKVNTTDDEGSNSTTTVYYTNSEITTPIENKGAIMLFDDLFDIDMDDMAIAYYAGMLGKATKNLPLRNVDEEGYANTFEWTLNAQGLPTKLSATYSYPDGSSSQWPDVTTFKW